MRDHDPYSDWISIRFLIEYVATPRGYIILFRTISPPFITNLIRSSSEMSLKGFPATAMISAYLPF